MSRLDGSQPLNDAIDGATVRRWSFQLTSALTRYRGAIDALNVYPVADRDTGTNLAATARAAGAALATSGPGHAAGRAPGDVGDVLAVLANGAVLGAHGNSGVIFAQLLRGLAESCAGLAVCDGAVLKKALHNAADLAFAAVAEPAEGTILTVARAAADGADTAPDSVSRVLEEALAAADRALVRTRQQLPALRAAGVVDAGAAGFVVALAALRTAATGEPSLGAAPSWLAPQAPRPSGPGADPDAGASGYEIQFLVEALDSAMAGVRHSLEQLGDSLVIAGTGEGRWNVHIHADDVAGVIAAASAGGRVYRISVSDLYPVHTDPGSGSVTGPAPRSGVGLFTAPGADVAVVAACTAPAIAELLRAEGVGVVTEPPRSDAWLDAIGAVGAASVVLLAEAPAHDTAAAEAAQRARAAGLVVVLVPVRSVVQTLAAVAVHDAARRFDDDVIAMAESAAATRWASVTTESGPHSRDVVGAIGDERVSTGTDVISVGLALLERLLEGGGELVTVVVGAGAPADTAVQLAAGLSRSSPRAIVNAYPAGQAVPALLLGVE